MQTYGKHLFYLIYSLSTWIASLEGYKRVCNMERNGNSGTLTCTFSMDIGQKKYDFNVLHYELHVTPEIVLACIWEKDTGQRKCKVKQRYQFDEKLITNKIILHVESLPKEHEGWYVCQAIPTLQGDNMTQPCDCKQTGARPVTDDRSTHLLIAVAVLCVAIIAGVLGFVAVMLRRWIQHSDSNRNAEPRLEEEEGMPLQNIAPGQVEHREDRG